MKRLSGPDAAAKTSRSHASHGGGRTTGVPHLKATKRAELERLLALAGGAIARGDRTLSLTLAQDLVKALSPVTDARALAASVAKRSKAAEAAAPELAALRARLADRGVVVTDGEKFDAALRSAAGQGGMFFHSVKSGLMGGGTVTRDGAEYLRAEVFPHIAYDQKQVRAVLKDTLEPLGFQVTDEHVRAATHDLREERGFLYDLSGAASQWHTGVWNHGELNGQPLAFDVKLFERKQAKALATIGARCVRDGLAPAAVDLIFQSVIALSEGRKTPHAAVQFLGRFSSDYENATMPAILAKLFADANYNASAAERAKPIPKLPRAAPAA